MVTAPPLPFPPPEHGPSYEAVATLLLQERRFSRNRHFDAYADRRWAPTLALYRRLRALVEDLARVAARAGRIEIVEEDRAGTPLVRLEIAFDGARRTTWLPRAAWEIVLQHPRARAALDRRRAAHPA